VENYYLKFGKNMSKIGYKSIDINEGVNAEISDQNIILTAPDGKFNINLPKSLSIEVKDNKIFIDRKKDYKKVKSLHGLYRSLIQNAVSGLTKPWEKHLEVSGTGYSVKLIGEDLEIKVGFSHPVIFKKIDGIKYRVEGNKKIVVFGSDKQKVGEVANKIRSIKIPDIYKGKGIKYVGEILRIKPGKKAKTEEAG